MNRTITFEELDLGGDDLEDVEVPARWEICDRCRGEGKHVNPSIDGHGITADERERDWDDESWACYMSGGYDVPCEARCQSGRVLVPDLDRVAAPVRAAIEARERAEAQGRAEDAYWRRLESGGER